MIQERDDIVALDSAIIQHPRTWEASGHLAGFTDPLVHCLGKCKRRFRADHLRRRPRPAATTRAASLEAARRLRRRAHRARAQFNLMFETSIGPVKEAGSTVYLRPETAQGIFLDFKTTLAVRAQEAAVRDRPGRQVVPQRDHARQLHLPHARVRADGDGVLRAARRGASSGTSTGWRQRMAWYVSLGIRPRPAAPARARRGRAVALLARPPATSSTSTRSAGPSWRASPTAATSTSPSTPSTRARSSTTWTPPAASATCRT